MAKFAAVGQNFIERYSYREVEQLTINCNYSAKAILYYIITSTRNIMENIPFFSNFRFGQTLFAGALITELQLLTLSVGFLYYFYLIY